MRAHRSAKSYVCRAARGLPVPVPIATLADSYKATHFLQYPATCDKLVVYGEFRSGFEKDAEDTRIVHYGIRYLVETYLNTPWSVQDLDAFEQFLTSHKAHAEPPFHASFPWPKDLFHEFVKPRSEGGNDGYFPIKVEALPEGTCTNAHVPTYQVTAEGKYARLATFMETLLTQLWYPSTVATLSRRVRDVIERAFEEGTDEGAAHALIPSRLHDFGMRGCTGMEQSVIGGCAHLLNFTGTDTMSAAFYAQFELNEGRPVAASIPATEHSVMMAWHNERAAMLNMVDCFGDGMYAIVMDSYDYTCALEQVLPSIKAEKVGKGGFLVLRPDSGDPVEVVLQALRAAENVFGATVNSKGFRVLTGAAVIQGDGVTLDSLTRILAATLRAGYSPENVAFGMGGGLLQRVHRDMLSFATKLCHLRHTDGTSVDVMKDPATDPAKRSLPGVMAVKALDGVPLAFPQEAVAEGENMLEIVYDNGPVDVAWPTFDDLRLRVASEWAALRPHRARLGISKELAAKQDAVSASLRRRVHSQ